MSITNDIAFESETDNCKQKWFVLLFRGVCGVITNILYNVSLAYSEAGDVLLIEFVFTMLTSLLFGWIFFSEKYNSYILISVIICIGGTILVTQPSFIFGNNSSVDTMNFYGFIFISLGGIIRGFAQALIKHSFTLEINWISIVLVPQLIGCGIMIIVYIIGYFAFEWRLINDKIDNNVNYSLLLLSIGLLGYLWYVFYTLAFRIGDIGRMGILQNCNIVFGYICGFLINVSNNYVCYIGVVLVLISCVCIFVELRMTRDIDTTENEQDTDTMESVGNDRNNYKYQPINDPIHEQVSV